MSNSISTSTLSGSIESQSNVGGKIGSSAVLGSVVISANDSNNSIEADSLNAASLHGSIKSNASINGNVSSKALLGSVGIPKSVTKYERYSFEEGEVAGAFLVTNDKGERQTVPIHGLHKIATSGNVNDLEQNEDDYVMLYCGTSTKVI